MQKWGIYLLAIQYKCDIYLTQAVSPSFQLHCGTINPVFAACQSDRLGSGCVRAAVRKNNCICVYPTTTSDMYMCASLPDSERSLRVENVSLFIWERHSAFWQKKTLQNTVGDIIRHEALYIDSSFHELQAGQNRQISGFLPCFECGAKVVISNVCSPETLTLILRQLCWRKLYRR